MERIVISNDSTIENVNLGFSHILPDSGQIKEKSGTFKPLESLTGRIPENFFPAALTSLSAAEASACLNDENELRLFFKILLDNSDPDALFERILASKQIIQKDNYLNFMVFLLLKTGSPKEKIIAEIKKNYDSCDPVADLLISFYDESPHETKTSQTQESFCADFFEALKAEKAGNPAKAFSMMLDVFEKSDFHPFIFEILKFYMMQYSGIPAEKIGIFTKKVTESSLPVSFTTVKFIEFIYYYKNNIEDKLEETVSVLAENTDSVFILNIIAPLLYKYKKWHLVGKFYKLSSKKALGAEKTQYLELLADIYEKKLELPDFAAEIYTSIAEEDPLNCTFSLYRAAILYEENESWEKLAPLYLFCAERESDPASQAVFYYKTGEIFRRRLNDIEKATEYFEKSLAAHYSFEAAHALGEICLKSGNIEKYREILQEELPSAHDDDEKIKILEKIAACRSEYGEVSTDSEKYLLEILKIAPKNLNALKKLGKIYYETQRWEELTEINLKEIDVSKNITDIKNLYYKTGVVFYENIKDFTRATECFREVLDIDPDHMASLLYLEKIYIKTGEVSGLLPIYSQITELNANIKSQMHLACLTKLALIFRDGGQPKKAAGIFAEIVKHCPENITAKENSRMLNGSADFSCIETECIDYNEYDFELLIEYIKQNVSYMMTDEILRHTKASFWKELYFLYKGINIENEEFSYGNKELFILYLLGKEAAIDVLVKNSTKKTALFLLAEQYIKTRFFEGISILLDFHLNLEPKNERKMWSLFFKGCENPNLKDDLEELLTTVQDKQSYEIISEILERIYIENKDFKTALFIRNFSLQKITNDKEKCAFIDKTISLLGENIAPDKLVNLYKNRIKSTTHEDLNSFFEIYESQLFEIGQENLLVPLYEEKWKNDKEIRAGRKLVEILIKKKDLQHAAAIAAELFETDKTMETLELYIKILRDSGETDAVIHLIKEELPLYEQESRKKLKNILFEILTENGKTEEAAEFFGESEQEKAKIEEKIQECNETGDYERAERIIDIFIRDPYQKQIWLSKTAKNAEDLTKETRLLKEIVFDAVSEKDPYPLTRLHELEKSNRKFTFFIEKALEYIGEKNYFEHQNFPNIFAAEKEEIFKFAGFDEYDYLIDEFLSIISTIPEKTKINAKQLNSSKHRILTQLIEYIKLSCRIDDLEGLWDENSDQPYRAFFANIPYIIFGPKSLETDFDKLKFDVIRDSFKLSCGIIKNPSELTENMLSELKFTGKDKIRFVKSIRATFQNRVLELTKLLENIDENKIKSFFSKMDTASFFHAFSLVPDIEEAKKLKMAKTKEFTEKHFF